MQAVTEHALICNVRNKTSDNYHNHQVKSTPTGMSLQRSHRR
jgi:hypothetical protein